MNVSKVHHCKQQEAVVEGKKQPPARPCRCRLVISLEEANDMVSEGIAAEVVIKREYVQAEVDCRTCGADNSIYQRNCTKCGATGKVSVTIPKETKNFDIVLLKHRRKSTPRVATIESEHIEYAYVNQDPKAAARIEEYGLLTLEARAYPGPSKCTHRKEFQCTRCQNPLTAIPAGSKEYVISMEPADNPKTGEGRTFDYGRGV